MLFLSSQINIRKERAYFPAPPKVVTVVLPPISPALQVAELYEKASWAIALVLAGSLRAPRMTVLALFTYYQREEENERLDKFKNTRDRRDADNEAS